jgi:putative nucleotidyltransferase with HDIG domain
MEALPTTATIPFGAPPAPALRSRARELERIAAGLERRVPGSAAHLRRVSLHAAGVAKRMGLPREQIERIRRAGALHDIGKVETPVEIVNKPGPLSEAEFAVVRRHAVVGAWMVAGLGDEELAAIVRHHHERLDGRGYPDGLAGEEIPLGSRIIAACDAYDAMFSERAYDKARPPEVAIAELVAHAGTQFDPRVVQALRAHLQQAAKRAAERPRRSVLATASSPLRRGRGEAGVRGEAGLRAARGPSAQ